MTDENAPTIETSPCETPQQAVDAAVKAWKERVDVAIKKETEDD